MAQMTVVVTSEEVNEAQFGNWEMGDDVNIATGALAGVAEFPVPDAIKEAFWRWYDEHSEDVILKKKFLIFNVEVRVKHLRFLFERFFGQHP